jgi:hypothetical protein
VSLVEEDPIDHALDGLVERGILEDDVRGLATELEREALARADGRTSDLLADLSGPGERDLVDGGVHQSRTGLPCAGDDVDDARRDLRIKDHLGQQQRGERGRLRRLQHGGVPRGQGRRELPRRHQHREVPRDDLAGHADRSRRTAGERVFQLVGPAGVVEEMRSGQRKVDVARFLDRLPAVHRFQHRELARPLLQLSRDAVQVLRALGARQPLPPTGSVPCRIHSQGDVLGTGLCDLRQRFLGRGRDRRERPP